MKFNINKVFSAANADEIEVGSIGCFANDLQTLSEKVNGDLVHKVTEIKPITSERRFVSDFNSKCVSDCSLFYLVEEPTKYHPYKNTDEMIKDFEERYSSYPNFDSRKNPLITISLLYIKHKEQKSKHLITDYFDTRVQLSDDNLSLEDLFEQYVYLDGSVIGIKEN
jgi:phosphoribosylformylglycinamidine (FGAM) synthase-like enzyme